MSNAVTHRKVGETYQISLHGEPIAQVAKEAGQFSIYTDVAVLPTYEFRTMKELKETVVASLPASLLTAPKPPKGKLGAGEAMKKLGLSGNGRMQIVQHVREVWPRLPKADYGDRIYRLCLERQAQWPYGEYARKWLEVNPEVGAYDVEAYERRCFDLYGE